MAFSRSFRSSRLARLTFLFPLRTRAGRTIAAVLSAAIASAGLAWGVAASQAGCQLQGSCDSDTASIPGLAKEPNGPDVTPDGIPIGAGMYGNAWQSGPIEGHWLWFPGQRSYLINPTLPDGGAFVGPYVFVAYVSADPYPYTTSGSNFAPADGNLTEFAGFPDQAVAVDAGTRDGGDGGIQVVQETTGFAVMNGTCSPYYLWLQVTQEPALDAGTSPPPSTDAQIAPTSDAGED